MPDWHALAAILPVGAVCYAMRAGGFLAASAMPAVHAVLTAHDLLPRERGRIHAAYAQALCAESCAPGAEADATREARADRELLAAGITPDHPSLYPPTET